MRLKNGFLEVALIITDFPETEKNGWNHMKKFELHGNAASLIFHEGTGEYRIATSSFLLAGCKPLLRLNGKEVSFGHWSVTEHTKDRCEEKYELYTN